MNNVNKWTVILIAGVVAIAAFLFLPLMSVSYGGTELASATGMDYVCGEVELSYMGQTQTIEVELTFDMIIMLVAGAVAIFASYKKSVMSALIAGGVGFVITLINIFDAPGGDAMAGGSVSLGLGIWVPLICYAGIAALAWILKKEQQAAPTEIQQ